MKSFKKLTNTEISKNYVYILMMIFLINNLKAFGSENKSYSFQNIRKDAELEEIYRLNSIPFAKYDSFHSQLKTFFGLYL